MKPIIKCTYYTIFLARNWRKCFNLCCVFHNSINEICLFTFFSFSISLNPTRILIYVIGNKEIALLPIDPLHLDKFSIVQNEQSPVNIRLHLRNITVTGLKDVVVSKVVLVDSLLSYRSLHSVCAAPCLHFYFVTHN